MSSGERLTFNGGSHSVFLSWLALVNYNHEFYNTNSTMILTLKHLIISMWPFNVLVPIIKTFFLYKLRILFLSINSKSQNMLNYRKQKCVDLGRQHTTVFPLGFQRNYTVTQIGHSFNSFSAFVEVH